MASKAGGKVLEPKTEYLSNDGYFTPTVGAWAELKYRFIAHYNTMFSTGMKGKWDKRVYIDLFAGAGRAQIKNTNKIVRSSPLIALNVPDQYDRYIFCEQDERCLEALQTRVSLEFPNADVQYVLGDCNQKVDEIKNLIPKYSMTNKVLTFCFVDPFSLGIDFNTIRSLGQYFVDFLILLALAMDANRNETIYVAEDNHRVATFLGLEDWRERWKAFQKKDPSFRRFLAREYASQMIDLNYLGDSLKTMIEVRAGEMNLPLYHLAFFSRSNLGYRFWLEGKQRIDEPELPFT